jgi:hypothetical protein
LFVIAAIVRVAMLKTARFGGDEALFFRIGLDIVDGHALPLLGTQITDGQARLPGPTFLYLMALPLWVWRAPEAQYLFVELLGAVTVVVQWHLLRRPFGERAAFLTGLVVACAPWSALYADRTWNPNVLPFVVTLAVLAAERVRADAASCWWTVLLPLLAVMPHFHMGAPVAWAGVLVLAGRNVWRPRVPRRDIVVALVLVTLAYVPLLVHELQTGFGNIRHILAETVGRKGGERHPWGFVWVPVYAFRFLTLDVSYHELSGYWGGPDEAKQLHAAFFGSAARPFHPLRSLAFATSLGLALGAAGSAVQQAWRRRSLGPWGAAFVAALVANTALMGVAAKQVFGHYVTCLYPFVVIAFAAFFARVFAQVFGRALTGEHPRPAPPIRAGTVVVIVAVVIVMVGGVEATWSVSRNVDARIGLGVHRCAAERIVDAARAVAEARARLEFRGLRSSVYDWQIFIAGVLDPTLQLDRGRSLTTRVRFALAPAGAPRPRDAADDDVDGHDCGAARLWRLR